MSKVRLGLGSRSYEILIGPGLLSRAGQRLKELGFGDKAVIVTDPAVKELHGDRLDRAASTMRCVAPRMSPNTTIW